jgi:hypothetical protein
VEKNSKRQKPTNKDEHQEIEKQRTGAENKEIKK